MRTAGPTATPHQGGRVAWTATRLVCIVLSGLVLGGRPSPGAWASGPVAVEWFTAPSLGAAWPGVAGRVGVPPCPPSGHLVDPGASIQAALDAYGPGATICVRGEHRLSTALHPKTDQIILGVEGVLNGSVLVTNWSPTGSGWVSTGHAQSFPGNGSPTETNPIAAEFEDLFMDDRPLTRVAGLGELGPGGWYFDEDEDRIYISDDPTGHVLETTNASNGIDARGVPDVTVIGLRIEKFANDGIRTNSGWVVARCVLRYMHSEGIRIDGSDITIAHNYIHHNGQIGATVNGSKIVIEENELSFNNYLHFGRADGGLWHAGAIKIHQSSDILVRNNHSHDNFGDGLWLDWDNIRSVIEGNLFENNERSGLLYEASFQAVVRDNVFTGNPWGIFLSTSKDVEITGNTFEHSLVDIAIGSTDRGTSNSYGVRSASGLHVHDNSFHLDGGYAISIPFGESSIPPGSRFEGDRYIGPDASGTWWDWVDGPVSWSAWRAYGFDRSGALTPA